MSIESIKTDFNVAIPMRDGTVLRADIFRPDSDGTFPTLVMRTPYDKLRAIAYYYFNPMRMARSGYSVVMQDCRGCFASDGEFYPLRDEAQDGYDTVEWVANQDWSNQRVGMYGGSYVGAVQWAAASEQPPHLLAIAPGMSLAAQRNLVFRGGVFQLQTAQQWTLTLAAWFARKRLSGPELAKHLGEVIRALDHIDSEARYLPLKGWPIAKEAAHLRFYYDWLAHPENDGYWKELSAAAFDKTNMPAYVIGGWHDALSAAGALSCYTNMKRYGGTAEARKHTKLIVGPWGHEMLMMQKVGDIDYGMMASGDAIDLMGIHLRWFDRWLKGVDNGITDEPPVRIFVMGDNLWRSENEWPLARTQYINYYLRRNTQTGGHKEDGYLSTELPSVEEPDVFTYDPLDPVPTHGGSCLSLLREFGPLDQRAIEARPDVLVYTTPTLTSDLEITGPVTLKLFAQSSALDTDFTATLTDVWPNGESYILLDGIVRARYRISDETPSFIKPDKVYEYTIDLVATSNVFKAGHRLRVAISSSNFPKYDRNPNTGHQIGVDAETLVATQRIFHDRERPSHLILPVIPR